MVLPDNQGRDYQIHFTDEEIVTSLDLLLFTFLIFYMAILKFFIEIPKHQHKIKDYLPQYYIFKKF